MEELKLIDNPAKHRFETHIGDDLAYIEYAHFKGDIVLMHTFVPEALRGQGIAGRMIRLALEFIKAERISIIVYCPVITKFIETHQEYKNLLDEKYAG